MPTSAPTRSRPSGRMTFPPVRSALLAGALLAFALSFDEIIVTTFTAGPGCRPCRSGSSSNLFRPNQAPVVNVVAAVLIVLSIMPIWVAQSSPAIPPAAGSDRSTPMQGGCAWHPPSVRALTKT